MSKMRLFWITMLLIIGGLVLAKAGGSFGLAIGAADLFVAYCWATGVFGK